MSWAKSFYLKQSELCSDCYFHDDKDYANQKVAIIKQLTPSTQNKCILDIGAGGGQNAVAMSHFSKEVQAIELLDEFVKFGKNLIQKNNRNNCFITQGDFYTYTPECKFDIVTYWDGFGVGSDDEQIILLTNIAKWLNDDGFACIEIYTPWYADYSKNKEMTFGDAKRRYGFDFENCRWLDSWWKINDEQNAVQQSLRCYSPADLKLLVKNTGLVIDTIIPCLNYTNFESLYSGDLSTSLSYLAILKH